MVESTLDALLCSASCDFDGLDEAVRQQRVRNAMFGTPATPVRLGRYELVRDLGAGAMGLVFLARDPDLGREVVLKTVHPVLRNDAAYRSRLLREAHALARLAHPHVVTVFDVGATGEELFIAMEHVDGPSLREWCEAEGRGRTEILSQYLDVGRGLAAAHAEGIVHRDFKPDNAVVGSDGRVRVLDFGLAAIEGGRGEAPPHAATSTIVGGRIGTPAYMAPEQQLGRRPGPAADQYAWAASLREAWGDAVPLPPGVGAVLDRATADDPQARWGGIEEAVAAIEAALARRRRRPRILAAGAIAVVCAGAGVAGARAWTRAPAPCRDPEARLADAWSEQQRERVRDGLVATGRPHAAVTATAVADELDRYGQAWLATVREACDREADRALEGTLPCLRGRRIELQTMVERLAVADGEMADRAAEAVLGLSPVASCLDPAHARAEGGSDAVASAVEHLSRARATDAQGSLPLLDAALAELPPGEHDALRATVLLELAIALVELARYDEAEARLYEAHELAAAAEHHDLEARVRAKLVTVLGRYQGRDDAAVTAAEVLGREADADLDPRTRAELVSAVGLVHHTAGRFEKARALHEQALALRQEAGDAWGAANAMHNIGASMAMAGQVEGALAMMERVAAQLERVAGPDHPEVAEVATSLGMLRAAADRPADASESFERAVAVLEGNFGPDHPPLSHPLAGLGQARLAMGDAEGASEAFERALTLDAASGALDARRAKTLFGAAEALAALGRNERARDRATDARAEIERPGQLGIDAATIDAWLADQKPHSQ